MSLRAVALVALVGGPAAFASGLWRGEHPPEPADVVRPRAANAPVIAPPGQGVAEAGAYLASLNAPPPPPRPPGPPAQQRAAPPPASPPPPPPDVAVLFRRELSAVLNQAGAEPRVVLASTGLGGGRSLARGDVYRDGWTLSALTPTTAVLSKGAETRNIGLFSAPPAQPGSAAPVQPAFDAGRISFNNSVRQGQLSGAQIENILGALRESGRNEQQVASMRELLSGQEVSRQVATQLLQQLTRGGQIDQARLNTIINAFASAGILTERQGRELAESLPQRQQMQQLQEAMSGRGGANTGNAGGNRGGQNAGRGGRGGFNGPPGGGGGPQGRGR